MHYDESRRGLAATRVLKSLIIAGGDWNAARAHAMGQNYRDTPLIETMFKSAIAAQGTENTADLSRTFGADLMALVRPREIIGRLVGVRRIPFGVPCVGVNGGTASNWVGEGKPAPVSKLSLSGAGKLQRKKVLSLSVITEELARSSAPSAESALSTDVTQGLITGCDSAFVDSANPGITGKKPAAVTYGSPSFTAAGTTVADIDAGLGGLQASLISYGSTLEFAAYIMHPATLAALALKRDSSGALAYPSLNARTGGFLGGIPVIPSASVPRMESPTVSYITLLDASRVWIADEGELEFTVSRQAAIEMLDEPTNDSSTPAATTSVSMFQSDAVALLGMRTINWAISNSGAAAVLQVAI